MTCPSNIPGGFAKGACLLWLSYLNPSTRYFEWGSGFTTRTADALVKDSVSIEGSKSWHDSMRQFNFSRTQLVYVDIGKTGSYSWPKNSSRGHEYIHSVRKYGTRDVILVDGRWRVACALASVPRLSRTGRMLVHDFQRAEYHVLLKHFELETRVDNLAVLVPRRRSGHADVLASYETDAHRA